MKLSWNRFEEIKFGLFSSLLIVSSIASCFCNLQRQISFDIIFVGDDSTDLFSSDLKAESKRRPSVVRDRLTSLLVICYTLLSFSGYGFLGFNNFFTGAIIGIFLSVKLGW